MTLEQFKEKHGFALTFAFDDNLTKDVLMIIASNLSDVQHMGVSDKANEHLNNVKRFIFDYQKTLK
jgi:hypothetical protein